MSVAGVCKRRLAHGVSLALLAALAIQACGPAGNGQPAAGQSGQPADKQVLRFLTINMPRSLDPIHIDAQRIINNGLAEPLIMQNDDATLRPWLATSWKNVEPTLWEFQLQPNVKFWSGAPVDATAVKLSMERHQKKNTRAVSILAGWEFIAKDARTLQVRTPKPDPGLPFRIAAYPVHNAEAADRLGDKVNLEPDLTGWFKPVQFVPGEVLIAEANKEYWGEKPKLQRLEARLATDPQARLLALRAGDADAEYNVEIDQRLDYEQSKDQKFQVYAPAPSTRTLWLNIKKNPALQDLRVRQALSLSVDRDELIQGLNHGFALPATGHFPTGVPYALDAGSAVKLDRARAGQLLDQAGWRLGADGVRAKDGQKLSFKILTYTVFQPLAVALQSQWKKVGISTELNPVETTASNQLMLDGNFEIATYCSCGSQTGDIAGQLRAFYRSGVVSNYGGYSNPEVDQLIDQLATEFDQNKTIQLARQVEKLVQDDVAVIYLFSSTQWGAAYTSKVQGVDKNLSRHVLPSIWIAR